MKNRENSSATRRLLRAMKWLVPCLLVGGLIALAFVPRPVEVDLGPVIRGQMLVTVDDDGETRVRERYIISAPLPGRLSRIALDPGDSVKKGDVLAVINPSAPSLLDPRARAQAEALVSATQAAARQAERLLNAAAVDAEQRKKAFLRDQGLREKGNIAEAKFEESERGFRAAEHARAAAEASVEVARFENEQAKAALLRIAGGAGGSSDDGSADWRFIIRSPIDGRVLRVYEESSRDVAAGAALLQIGDPGELEIRIDVLSQDAVKIRPGQRVIIDHWGGEDPLEGNVRLVEPSAYTKVSALGVDEQRVDVIADFAPEQAVGDALGDGYRIEARIVVWEGDDTLQIPAGALFRQGDQWAAFRADGDRARLVTVALGQRNGEAAEVRSGLAEGDEVILHPGDRIVDGSLIKPRS